jgi:hypothetical protein
VKWEAGGGSPQPGQGLAGRPVAMCAWRQALLTRGCSADVDGQPCARRHVEGVERCSPAPPWRE